MKTFGSFLRGIFYGTIIIVFGVIIGGGYIIGSISLWLENAFSKVPDDQIQGCSVFGVNMCSITRNIVHFIGGVLFLAFFALVLLTVFRVVAIVADRLMGNVNYRYKPLPYIVVLSIINTGLAAMAIMLFFSGNLVMMLGITAIYAFAMYQAVTQSNFGLYVCAPHDFSEFFFSI